MEDLNKRYYRMREVAEIIGLPPSTLRFWESKFTVINPRRNQGGQRLYTPADIEKLRMVHFLVKEKGLKLEAAQEELSGNSSGVSRRFEALSRLRSVRSRLEQLHKALQSLK